MVSVDAATPPLHLKVWLNGKEQEPVLKDVKENDQQKTVYPPTPDKGSSPWINVETVFLCGPKVQSMISGMIKQG